MSTSRQLTRPSPLKSAQRRPDDGVAVAVGTTRVPFGCGVFVAVSGNGVLVLVAGTGVLVLVDGTGVLVFVGGTGVLVFVGVDVGVFVDVRVGVLVGVAVGVLVGVAVGSGPIQIVTLVKFCMLLPPVASNPMVCEPSDSVDELRVNPGPVPRKPFCDDDQNNCPRTSGVPSESVPIPAKVITVFSGITAPFDGEVMLTLGGPTATANAGVDELENIASDATTNAAKAKKQVRTATPIVN